MNLLRRKVNVKTFQFKVNLHQAFKMVKKNVDGTMMVKQVSIEQWWMF